MKFWDSSAVLPLLVEESGSNAVGEIFEKDHSIVVWWGTSIECISAISRLEREQKCSTEEAFAIIERLNELRTSWREIQPAAKVKQIAERILRLHPLRAQDSQQLAACVLANSENRIEFVTLDQRLSTAAKNEGLILAL